MISPRRTAGAAVVLVLLATPASAKEPVSLPGVQPDGAVLLPNQWSLRPVGRQIAVGDFPVNLALHPAGRYAAVLHSGFSQHEIRILDLQSGEPVSQVTLDETFYGLAWSADGSHLYASGGSREVIDVFAFDRGYLSAHTELRIRPEKETGVPIGIAIDASSGALFAAEGWGQRVDKINPSSGQAIWTRVLAAPMGVSDTDPGGPRLRPANAPDAPFPYTCLPDAKRRRVYVSLWGAAAVLVLDAKTGAEVGRWPVGPHPNELALTRNGRLFVAEANANTVSVLDTATGRILESLATAPTPNAPPGSMPNSLALSPDQKLLFVANADNNTVAVFDVSSPGQSVSLGLIPVGWFPTSVRVTADGRTLVVANGKGVSSAPNPGGPFPGDTRPGSVQQYIGGLFKGTVSLIELPTEKDRAARFGGWTREALATRPAAVHRPEAAPTAGPVPAAPGGSTPIRHVIYVVKENRTYDQVFGDLPLGNGAPQLCLFPETITPNHHALAREFVLLDNFYADGEVSADGHEWSLGAFASDFVEKAWPVNYGHDRLQKIGYPAEGEYPIAAPAQGYLWDQAARAGVTYRSYGEFVFDGRTPDEAARPALSVLRGHIDPLFRGFDLDYPDVQRIARFAAVLKDYEAAGEMPRLQVVRLPNDHTAGTRPGSLTPRALVADNDLALGRLVEAVSHSKFWATTAIFVLEDDAQNGPDHVDAHRIPAFVISPYTARRTVDSTLYSTTSMLRTIELILGLPPMSQFDAAAAPMTGSFTARADLTPYDARPATVDLNEKNSKTAWGAQDSAKMDFREADRVDDLVLNEIVWRSVKGAHSPMPAPVRAAFFKANPKTDRDDD